MSTPKELPALPKAAYSLDLNDGHPVVAYSVQQMYDFAREHAASLQGIERDAARALDDAFKVEIERVSTVQYNSNEICRAFYERLRSRFDAAMKDAP